MKDIRDKRTFVEDYILAIVKHGGWFHLKYTNEYARDAQILWEELDKLEPYER